MPKFLSLSPPPPLPIHWYIAETVLVKWRKPLTLSQQIWTGSLLLVSFPEGAMWLWKPNKQTRVQFWPTYGPRATSLSNVCLSQFALRCWSKSNQNACVCAFIVCPLNIHTVFSVLVHSALVQIHFSWSVSLFHPGQSISVSLIPCRLDKRCVAMISSSVWCPLER